MYSSGVFPAAGTHGTDGLGGACASGFHAAERSIGAHPTANKATTARTWRDRIRDLLRPGGASKRSRFLRCCRLRRALKAPESSRHIA
jgi:hypothetical protein